MQHHFVSDGHIVAKGQWLPGVGVQHAILLNVAAAPDADGFQVVAPDHRTKPDIRALRQFDISNHYCAVCNPGTHAQLGRHAVEFINCHREFPILVS